MSIPSSPTTASTTTTAARTLSAERERHRAASLASATDAEARARFALPDPSSPDHESALIALEAEIDRSIAQLDRAAAAEDDAKTDQALQPSADDPAPLSDYKRAEIIKRDAD